MKKTVKYLALAFMGFAAVSCSDEDIVSQGRPVVGDEITFGASASVEGVTKGGPKDSRTSYGDVTVVDGVKKIAINWCEGDSLVIGCEQSASSAKSAVYRIPKVNVDGGVIEGGADNNSATATVLERVSKGVGLQWGAGQNTFRAAYPSHLTLSGNKVTGKMPSTYEAQVIDKTPQGAKTKTYEFTPSMDYAYMVAEQNYDKPAAAVGLNFTPIVTALEFDVVMNEYINGKTTFIKINSLELRSASQNIVGNFEYDYTTGRVTNTTSLSEGANHVLMTFEGGQQLHKGDRVKATFFIIPSEKEGAEAELLNGDLTLRIMYQDQTGGVFFKHAKVGVDLQARKKYFFKNMLMPKLNPLTTSNWFENLDNDIYISQLSFPTAGNVVSNQYNGSQPTYHKEQVFPFKRLWDGGIRGFELRTSFNEKEPAGVNLDGLGIAKGTVTPNDGTVTGYEFALSPFVCAGQEVFGDGNLTFGGAFQKGYEALLANPKETLVYLLTYQSRGGDNDYGYRPDLYLQGLQNYLDGFCTKQGKKPEEIFVQLGTESTVADLRGKIAIIVRLYDNDYVELPPAKGKKPVDKAKLVPNATWGKLITVVNNWGTCIDNWDVRFGYDYAREGQFVKTGKKEFEMNMWYGASTTDKSYQKIDFAPEHTGTYPTFTLNANSYKFNVNSAYLENDNGITGNRSASVQAWERVIPATDKYYLGITDNYQNVLWYTAYLWGEWKESLSEKVKASRFIADRAMATRGQSSSGLFINSLTGYFPVTHGDLPGSCNPYSKTQVIYKHHSAIAADPINLSLGGQVTGGDYAACAGMLNAFMYGYLIRKTPEQMGPLGLVLMDYIGADETYFGGVEKYKFNIDGVSVNSVTAKQAANASTSLARLIISNNFRFALTKRVSGKSVTTTETSSPQKMEGDGNIISFE